MTEDQPKPADPAPPMSERDEMMADYLRERMEAAIRLRQVRTPQGLAGLFPGLGKKRK